MCSDGSVLPGYLRIPKPALGEDSMAPKVPTPWRWLQHSKQLREGLPTNPHRSTGRGYYCLPGRGARKTFGIFKGTFYYCDCHHK